MGAIPMARYLSAKEIQQAVHIARPQRLIEFLSTLYYSGHPVARRRSAWQQLDIYGRATACSAAPGAESLLAGRAATVSMGHATT